MGWLVLVAVIAIPLIEISVFVKVAGWIGLLPAIVVAIVAGMGGLALWRRQGISTLAKAGAALDSGRLPAAELFDGLCLLVAGGLLLLPGFVSDVAALALLLPPVRALLRRLLARRFTMVETRATDGRIIIDAEYRTISEGDEPPLPPRRP